MVRVFCGWENKKRSQIFDTDLWFNLYTKTLLAHFILISTGCAIQIFSNSKPFAAYTYPANLLCRVADHQGMIGYIAGKEKLPKLKSTSLFKIISSCCFS